MKKAVFFFNGDQPAELSHFNVNIQDRREAFQSTYGYSELVFRLHPDSLLKSSLNQSINGLQGTSQYLCHIRDRKYSIRDYDLI